MAEPSIGDSKKKGIAVTGIVALSAMKPATKIEFAVVGCITLITIVAICVFAYLEKEKKHETIINPDVPAGD